MSPFGLGSGFACQVSPLPVLFALKNLFDSLPDFLDGLAFVDDFQNRFQQILGGIRHLVHVLPPFVRAVQLCLTFSIIY